MTDSIHEEIINETIERLKACDYDLLEIIGEEKVRSVLNAERTYKEQPLARLLRTAHGASSGNDQASQTYANTLGAIRIISRCMNKEKYEAWLNDRISQASDLSNFENASGALGEIRALGSLLRGFNDVDVIRETDEKTTDFLVVVDGVEIFIEATTKQMNKQEAEELDKFIHEKLPEDRGPVYTRTHVISPAGKCKKMKNGKYETTAENVASKMANIKSGSKQVKEGSICILWVDMQDEDWWGTGGDNSFPVTSWNGAFTTVGIWHSFYAKKGTPLFDQFRPFQGPNIHVQPMRFDGRYHQKDNRFCATALNFGRSLVFFDNPNADIPLPDSFWYSAAELSFFDYERSIIRWPEGLESLVQQLELHHRKLGAFANLKPLY